MKTSTFRQRIALAVLLAVPASTVWAEAGDEWQFSLTPYLWAAGVAGTVAAGGAEPPSIEPSYSFFALDNLQAAYFLAFSAEKGPWSVNTDLIHIAFSDDFSLGPLRTAINLDADAIELSAGYRLEQWPSTKVLVGARGISIDAGISLRPGVDAADGRNWWDPIVGVQHNRSFGERWGLLLRGDVGGFNVSSKVTLNGVVAGTYRFSDTFSAIFGYRYLAFDFNEDDFVTDLEVSGYAVGLNFRW